MIELTESHIDLMSGITFTQAQLIRRWDRELSRKWPPVVQMNLRDFIEIKDGPGADQLPNYAENVAMLDQFIADKQVCYLRRVTDEGRNALLKDAIAYEQAQRDVERLTLKIHGREAVEEVPEETDPETGETIRQFVAPISAVEPIPMQIESVDDDGNPATIENPAYVEAMAARDAAQAIIDGAGQDVLDLVAQRSDGN